MYQAIRSRALSIATIGIASALVVAGVATAQGESDGPPSSGQSAGKRMPPPPGAPPLKGLTYAELHVQKDGQEQVIRLDQGKIVSVDATSITLSENDGGEVTIALDESTRVMAGPGRDATVDDLSAGQLVQVCGPEGGAAKTVTVLPKPGQGPHGGHGGQSAPEGQPGPEGQSGSDGQAPPPPPGE